MKPAQRHHLAKRAFTPMNRTIDRRAEWYLRQIDLLTRDNSPPAPPPAARPRWHVAIEALAWWAAVATTALWLAHRWGWIA